MNDISASAPDSEPHPTASLPLVDALERIRTSLEPVEEWEDVRIEAALDRVLSQAVYSSMDVPGHDNSSMDGYALRFDDLASGEALHLVGHAFAGHVHAGAVGAGQCVRIMTGGVIPKGADTVVMQEKAQADGDMIRFEGQHRLGSNIRRRGEDIRAGELLLPAGRRLRAADLGLLASVGMSEVQVRRRLRIGIFSTGDELVSTDKPLGPGQIHDSNRYTLQGMLSRFGAELIDLGIIPDQRAAIGQALDTAAAQADVVITSGGVSVGEADYVTELLAQRGTIGFWKVAIKPGRPLAFGRLGKAAFFGLPGNPVSVMVTFYQIVLPALERLQGVESAPRLRIRAKLLEGIRKTDRRREFVRGVLATADDGLAQVRITGNQSSGVLRSMSEANCFIVLPEGALELDAGADVLVEPFTGF